MVLSLGLLSFPYKKFFEMCVSMRHTHRERDRQRGGGRDRETEKDQGREIGKHLVANVNHYSLQILKFTGKIIFPLL